MRNIGCSNSKSKVLITGGAGFIGSHIAEYYQGKASVRVLDNLRTGYLKNLEGLDIEFISGSILDQELLKNAVKGVDIIYHMAAFVSVPESMSRTQECEEINVLGLINTLKAATEFGVKRFVFASSAAIYGENLASPKVETMTPDPRSPYAISKLAGEFYCDLYYKTTGLKTTSLRFFNVFGPRQDPLSPYAAAVPIFIKKALENEPIKIFGDGEQTRDFIPVRDIVEAVVFAGSADISGVFNVGYGKSSSIKELAQEIISFSNSSSVIKYLPKRPGDIIHSLAGTGKIKAAGYRPVSSLRNGITETIEYFKSIQPA